MSREKRGELIDSLNRLKTSDVGNLVRARVKEFKGFCDRESCDIYLEMCFCFLTANYSAERSMRIHGEIGEGFIHLPEEELALKLKELGYRYPNARAAYVTGSREHAHSIKQVIDSHKDERELREWLVKNVKGLGLKEASHFLRNIGFENLAIIDFHIIDILARAKLCEKPKTLSKKRYLEIEDILAGIAKETGLTLMELDLYLWYMETGKVLK